MNNIAIIDDDECFAIQITDFIKRYHGSESDCKISYHQNPMTFMETYKPIYQIIFLDVEMPSMNGFEVANKIRKVDTTTIIIFITKMAQYAVRGYEVNALDYIIKPVSYYDFALKYKRALSVLSSQEDEGYCLHQNDGFVKLNIKDITYVEVQGHHCFFHTINGTYEGYTSLSNAKEKLLKYHFLQCNGYCIVNPKHITQMDANSIYVSEDQIPLSRPRKKEFRSELNQWLGEYSL